MSRPVRLIVTDASPLITLALAEALNVLLLPGAPIQVPDAVFVEATRIRTAGGATALVQWLREHAEQARIVPTETGIDQQRRLAEGRPIRGLGEVAAIEVLDAFLDREPEADALLLFEDTDLMRRRAVMDDRVGLLTTGDFLRELEAARLIQSSDQILARAAATGRNLDRQRAPGPDGEAQARLRAQLLGDQG